MRVFVLLPDPESEGQRQRNRFVLYILWASIAFILALRFIWIDDSLYERHSWRQADSLGMIRAFNQFGSDILHPMVQWKGGYKNHAFEFPLIQYLISFLFRFFGDHIWIAKLAFFGIFSIGLYYLYSISRLLSRDTYRAEISVLLYVVVPISVYYSISLQVDFFTLSACIAVLYHSLNYRLKSRVGDLIGFSIWLSVAALLKPPYLLAIMPALCAVVFNQFSIHPALVLALAALPGITAGLLWIQYSKHYNANTPDLTFLPGFSKGDDMLKWYFGTWNQRYDWENYIALLDRQSNLFGFGACAAAAVGLLIYLLSSSLEARLWTGTVVGCLGMIFIFFNLNLIHDYYQVPLTLAVAVLGGCALDGLARSSSRLMLACLLLVGINSTVVSFRNYFKPESALEEVSQTIRSMVKPCDLILVSNTDLTYPDPRILGRANRYGYNISPDRVSADFLDSCRVHHVYTMVAVNQYPAWPWAISRRLVLKNTVVTAKTGTKLDFYNLVKN